MSISPTLKTKAALTGTASLVALVSGVQAADAQDFLGAYVGGSVSTLQGTNPFLYTSTDYMMEPDATIGGFVGNNWQLGSNNVVGVELAYQGWTPGDLDDGSSYENYGINYVVDSKLRVGTQINVGSMGPALVYGFGGFSFGSMNNYWGPAYSFNGANYGAGVEVMVSSKMSIGVEVMGRSVLGYDGEVDSQSERASNHGQATLRAAFHF